MFFQFIWIWKELVDIFRNSSKKMNKGNKSPMHFCTITEWEIKDLAAAAADLIFSCCVGFCASNKIEIEAVFFFQQKNFYTFDGMSQKRIGKKER